MTEHQTLVNASDSPLDDLPVIIPQRIVKRDGREVDFDVKRIESALERCFASFGRRPHTHVAELSQRVVNIIAAKTGSTHPNVEDVQDTVELVLQAAGEFEAAKRYILYRAEHARSRELKPIPESIRVAFSEADQYFPTPLQKFQFFDKYSRFDYDLGRRETWIETVDRAVSFLREISNDKLDNAVYERIRQGILEMRVMPSMRLLAMAGPAARRNNIAVYNCSYLPVESIDAFVEALIISMSGCGVGFSVESTYVEQLPRIKRQTGYQAETFVVEDSAEGWAEALRFGLETWFDGGDVTFDLSQLRSAGAPLRIKGGRASGPEPFRVMLDFTRSRILARQGSILRPIDAHDIMCAIGNAAVSGGVRRCLPAGTRVHTRRGAIPIEQVTTNDYVMTAVGYKPVTGWVDQGVQAVVDILTESGTVFRCTPHHRVAVLTDVWGNYTFKYASDLKADDRLLFITLPIDGEISDLKPLPDKRVADTSGTVLVQPQLTTNTAWFLGKFFADGYVRVGEHGKGGNTNFDVASHADETEQIERVVAWMEQHGLAPRVERPENEHCVKVRSSNRQIARWMALYKQPNQPLVIPEEIWRAPRDIRAAFVAGVLDGDGSIGDRPTTIVSTVYESFARDVVKLLATLGIIAEFRCRRDADNEKNWQSLYVVSVKDAHTLQRCSDVIGVYSCKQFVPHKAKQSGYTMPREFVLRDLERKQFEQVWSSDNGADGNGADMNSATLSTITEANHFVPVKVIEVNPVEEHAHTYDIEVNDGSMFVAEGYLVHNTAMISLFDDHDHEVRHCKDGDFERDNSQRWNANNSLVWRDGLTQLDIARQFLDMVSSGRGEPGIFNRTSAINMRPERREAAEFGTNPCVTGDTWVAVADGRGRVQMRDLVESGRDVDVFTVKDGSLVIRTMRNPRKTGTQTPVYKVSFSDGSSIRVTGNHKFHLTDGVEKEALQLEVGDALQSMTVDSKRTIRFAGLQIAEDALIPTTSAMFDVTDLPLVMHDDTLYVQKSCEVCESAFEVLLSRREQAVCGAACSVVLDQRLHGSKQTVITPSVRSQQLNIYNDLVVQLNRHPLQQEWIEACKQANISHEISRVSSPFRYWKDLQESASYVNHRVVAVEADGFEDVFTGTVDETHTYFAIGTERLDSKGRVEMSYVLNSQCGEIILRPFQFCNLSAAVARADDTVESLREKVELATIIGTIQSMAVHFPGLRPQWRENCEQERLLGVDITGQMDSPVVQQAEVQRELRDLAVEVNREYAALLGINQSASVTCVKPSGNSSQLLNCSSGLHTRWAPYYIRNVRVSAHSPLYKVLRDAGVPMDPENGQTRDNATTWVIHFPTKSPDAAVTRKDRSALDQCEFWLQNKLNWTEHNPSSTITYKPDEVMDVMKWIWEHRDVIGGMAFLPSFDANYAQMPYVEISKEEYERLAAEFPPIDFSKLYRYEDEDLTNAAQELACMSGMCEIDTL